MKIKKFTGGLRWGDKFWEGFGNCEEYGDVTFPFASLLIEEDRCIITRNTFWIKYVSYNLKYCDIVNISIRKILWSKGVLFTHTNKDIPKYLLFWTRKGDEICDILSQYGVKVI